MTHHAGHPPAQTRSAGGRRYIAQWKPRSWSTLPADPVAALKALHTAEELEIRPQTNVIGWQGQRWDLGWAVESLLSY